MVHENLQAHVVGEDDVAAATHRRTAIVRRARVELSQQESRLRAVLVANDQARDREASREDLISLRLGSGEQLFESHVLGLILVVRLAPLCYGHAVENHDAKEGIENQDTIGGDRAHVQ